MTVTDVVETAAVLGILAAIFLYATHVDEDELLTYVRECGEVSSLLLANKFGSRAYAVLRRLARDGRLVRSEGPGTEARGGRPVVTYRIGK